MSDSDALNVAGVIGTWVAVFLAIVALVGILPMVILYKTSKTETAQALALLDDPSGNYVTRTFRFAGLRYRKLKKVPDLVDPPNLWKLRYNPQWKSQLEKESTSGWINFSNIINAVFSAGVPTAHGDDRHILVDGGETFLHVHPAWILVLAVLHCYAYRQDYGLPKEDSSQDHIKRFPWRNTLTGLSGGLLKHPSASDDLDEYVKVTFIMHPLSTPIALAEEDDIGTLILLSFGFVNMRDNTYFKHQVSSNAFDSRAAESAITIAQLKDYTISATDSALFSSMKLQVGTTKTISVVRPKDVFQDLRPKWDANSMEAKGYLNLGEFNPLSGNDNIWISREDAHNLSADYLFKTRFRRQGFLYAKNEDLIVSKLFSKKATTNPRNWALKWLSELDVEDYDREYLKTTLERISNSDLENTSWSRKTMQNLYELDKAIQVACNWSHWMFQSISVLFVCEDRFRNAFAMALDLGKNDNSQFVQFDTKNKKVELGRLKKVGHKHEGSFRFDFRTVIFKKPPTKVDLEDFSAAEAVFAALQGQIRALMWKMSLSPCGVHDFTRDSFYYISTRPINRVRNPREERYADPNVSYPRLNETSMAEFQRDLMELERRNQDQNDIS